MKHLSLQLKIVILVIFTLAINLAALAQIQNVNPDPNGEPWYVGGDGDLTAEEAAKVADEIPELQIPKSYKSAKNFPAQLDNSNQPYFRPIFNQLGGSCSQASGTSYHFTYEIDYVRGVPATDSIHQYPSHFTYNFLNSGSGENGSNYWDGWKIISELGCPNSATYGGLYNLDNYGWMSGYDKYYAGMHNTTLKYYSIDVSTPEGLNNLKAWFYNHADENQSVGGLANFSAGASDWIVQHLALGTPNWGDFFVLEFDSTIDHAMTFVGYNDSIRHDYNGDGQYTNHIDTDGDGLVTISDWEIGALIMANTWGGGWCDAGKAFVPYRCLTGKNHIRQSKVYVLEAKEYYEPKMAIKLNMSHPSRNHLKITAGAAYDTSATVPEINYNFTALKKKGGDFPMNGTTDSIEFGLDITKFYEQLHNYQAVRLFINLTETDTGNMYNGFVHNFSVYSYLNGTEQYVCADSNVIIIDDATTRLSVVIPGNGFYPPANFTTSMNYRDAQLNWDYPVKHPNNWEIAGYNIFKNNEFLNYVSDSTTLSFTDPGLEDGSYKYMLSCIYVNGTDTFESMPCDPSTVSLLYNPIASSGNQLYMDGVDDYILTDSIDIKNKSFSLEFWAKKGTSYHDDMVMGHGDWGTGSKALHFGFRDDRFYCGFYGDDISTDTTYTDGKWHHYCMTFDTVGLLQTLYHDGEEVASRNANNVYLGEGQMYIGAIEGDSKFFRGTLDEVRVWDYALTHEEVKWFMYYPPQINEPGLQACWRFDEPKGSIVADASGNQLDGTLMNFDAAREASDLWQYHEITPDTVLTLHAGYSPDNSNVSFHLIHPALCGEVEFNPITLQLDYLPINNQTQNWIGYDSLVYEINDGISTDTARIYINADAFPVILATKELHTDMGFSIFPNPANNSINIKAKQELGDQAVISIFSIDGRMMHTEQLNVLSTTLINCSNWNTGIYFIEVVSGNLKQTERISVIR